MDEERKDPYPTRMFKTQSVGVLQGESSESRFRASLGMCRTFDVNKGQV